MEYKAIRLAQFRGAKLIVLDPRRSENAEVADIWLPLRSGTDAELIAKAARMYATTGPATIPWSPITDQQVSSTSAIRLQAMPRPITGNLDIDGGENLLPFNPAVRSDSEIEMHEVLSDEQKAKQLGSEQFPTFTYRGTSKLSDACEKVWGVRWANLVSGCYMAHPMAVFKAMAEDDP